MQDQDRIRHRAHELWEREGRPDGRHEEHWRQAEQEEMAAGGSSSGAPQGMPQETSQGTSEGPPEGSPPYSTSTERAGLNPGDEAAPGTPGTGEDVCPECQGSGRVADGKCGNCGGTGVVIKGLAGG